MMDIEKRDKGIVFLSMLIGIVSLCVLIFDFACSAIEIDSMMEKSNYIDDDRLYSDRSTYKILIGGKEYRVSKSVYEKLPNETKGIFLVSGFSDYVYNIKSENKQFRSIDFRLIFISLIPFFILLHFFITGSLFSGWMVAGISLFWFSECLSVMLFN
ncbi:hypothetical protein NBRC116188_05980 [Oceaniserpentilla sp. 4NH20-0058]|uniref:hypothetical protein n=1 Tax=Oceaniserpentilla sp. 4NH20-0058 TaxID=3127660 RepID=UPI00310B698D